MDGNYLKELPKDIFSSLGLSHLQKISLKESNIQTIHESAFSDLKILKEINLAGNNLSSLPPQAFQGNDGLRTLLLGGNNIARWVKLISCFEPSEDMAQRDILLMAPEEPG